MTDNMSGLKEWSNFEEAFRPFWHKSDLEKEYDSAQSVEDLFAYFSEAIALSATSIMFTLKGPQKASIVLKVSGVTSKKSYDTYWDRLNRLFSQCLMIVRVRLRLALIRQLEPKDVENILNTAIPLAVVAFSKINQLSNKEREDLEKTFLEISSENALNPFKDDKDQMNRLFEAHGKKPTLKEIVAVVLAMQRSLSWIHPWPFVENWKRLKSQ